MKYTRDDKFLRAVGIRIRTVRIEQGLTQEQLSFKANIELSQINRIELGKINTSLSHLKIIADALEIQPKDLVDIKEEH